jgi:hypothetical protein
MARRYVIGGISALVALDVKSKSAAGKKELKRKGRKVAQSFSFNP